jgi:glycosyltransferase involved in cell wall biosynthesis
MKVSIILPVYNGEESLARTLDSLVAQTFKDYEILACIDGSHDKSLEIIESYKEKFDVLKIFQNENNRGLGPTMNRLVYNTSGEYIAVAEQDDYYYPYRIEKQVKILDTKKEVGIVSGIAGFWNGKQVNFKFPGILVSGKSYPQGEELFLLNYRKGVKVVNSCMMFRKQMHIENGLYFTQHFPSLGVDWTYILRASLVTQVYGLKDVLVNLDRRSERGSLTTKKDKMFRASRELIRSMKYEFDDIITEQDYKFALNTQRQLELGYHGGVTFLAKGLFYWFRYKDMRFYFKVLKKLKKKSGSDLS